MYMQVRCNATQFEASSSPQGILISTPRDAETEDPEGVVPEIALHHFHTVRVRVG